MNIYASNVLAAAAAVALVMLGACANTADDCALSPLACPDSKLPPLGGAGGTGGAGGNGGGGAAPCDGMCSGATPICEEPTDMCVGCLEDSHCSDVTASRCGSDNTCQPCSDNVHCDGLVGTSVCDTGTCVECSVDDSSTCGAMQTCNLLDNTCVDVAPEALSTCRACSNDGQCPTDHRCVPMDFMDAPHGHYCLKLPSPTCDKPYTTFINEPSINGVAAENYCGITETQATCEVILALLGDWVCTGTDGKCSPTVGEVEVDVPGAVCRQVGPVADRCTYACASAVQCLTAGPGATCGMGASNPPGWCGG